MKLINSPAGALSLEVQKKLHKKTVGKVALQVSKIVENLTQGGMHPFEAQLQAPMIHFRISNDGNLITQK